MLRIKKKTIGIKNPPNKPENIFFGLILVSFGPLNNFPNINPPMSVNTQINNTNNKIIKSLFSLKKYTEQNEIIK